MNPKIRNLILGVALLCVVGAIIVLTRNNGSDAPDAAAQIWPDATGSTHAAAQSTGGATTIDAPAGLVTSIPGEPTESSITVTITHKEKEVLAEAQRDNPQSVTSSDQCDEVLKTEPWCSIYQSVKQMAHPEWEQLLPKTEFYLVQYDRYGGKFHKNNIA